MIALRTARVEDASVISDILIASISDLCTADHGGNPQVIADWTANKTAENIALWIANPKTTLCLARLEDDDAGICAWRGDGEILLNYVSPNYQFRGVSTEMLAHMETELRENGVQEGKLTSTQTAHQFYRQAGWVDEGHPLEEMGIVGQPMTKNLVAL